MTRTPEQVRRYVDTSARHGWVYLLGDRWLLEHCTDGEWHACPLTEGRSRTPLPADAPARRVNMAAMRDLTRRPHVGPLPERLRSTHHA